MSELYVDSVMVLYGMRPEDLYRAIRKNIKNLDVGAPVFESGNSSKVPLRFVDAIYYFDICS